jgi:hypothetical protein
MRLGIASYISFADYDTSTFVPIGVRIVRFSFIVVRVSDDIKTVLQLIAIID